MLTSQKVLPWKNCAIQKLLSLPKGTLSPFPLLAPQKSAILKVLTLQKVLSSKWSPFEKCSTQSAHPSKKCSPESAHLSKSALPKVLTLQKVITSKCSPLRKVLTSCISVNSRRHCVPQSNVSPFLPQLTGVHRFFNEPPFFLMKPWGYIKRLHKLFQLRQGVR